MVGALAVYNCALWQAVLFFIHTTTTSTPGSSAFGKLVLALGMLI